MMMTVIVIVIAFLWCFAFYMRQEAMYVDEMSAARVKLSIDGDLLKRKVLFVLSFTFLGVMFYAILILWWQNYNTHFGCLPIIFALGAMYAVDVYAGKRDQIFSQYCNRFATGYVRDVYFMVKFSSLMFKVCLILAIATGLMTILSYRNVYEHIDTDYRKIICEDIVQSSEEIKSKGYYLAEDLAKFYTADYVYPGTDEFHVIEHEMDNVDVYLLDDNVRPRVIWEHEVKQKMLPDDYGRYVVPSGEAQEINRYTLHIQKDMFDALMMGGVAKIRKSGSNVNTIASVNYGREGTLDYYDTPYDYVEKRFDEVSEAPVYKRFVL